MHEGRGVTKKADECFTYKKDAGGYATPMIFQCETQSEDRPCQLRNYLIEKLGRIKSTKWSPA